MDDTRFYSFISIIMKAGKLSYGFNNFVHDIKADKCKLVIIAEDTSDNTKDKIISLCNYKKIPYLIYGKKNEFGLRIGKSSMSVLAIKDENMSKVVQDMLV